MPDLSRGLTLGEGLLLVFVLAAAYFLARQVLRAWSDLREAAAEQRRLEYKVMELTVQRVADAERWAAREQKERARRKEAVAKVHDLKCTLAEIQALFLAYRMGDQIAPDLDPLQRDLSQFGEFVGDESGDTVPQG